MAGELSLDLGRLFELLRNAGFRVDARQYLAAAQLLIDAARLGAAIDTDADRLRAHLGPIFCTSPEEQERFHDVVRAWLNIEPPAPPAPPPPLPFARLQRARWAIGIVVGLVAIGATAKIAYDKYKKHAIVVLKDPPPPPPPPTPPPPPPSDAGEAPAPTLRVASINTFEPAFRPPPAAAEKAVAWRQVALAAGGAGALVLFMWFGIGWLRRRLVLQRLPSRDRSELTQLAGADDVALRLFSEVAVRRASTALRRPRGDAALELELIASVEGAARGAGLVVPVYRSRRAIPEYVAFIERYCAQDHHARLCNELLDRLQTLGVAVERYYFTGDPRTCFEAGATSRSTRLADAIGRNHRAAALLFLDPSHCFNPYTGEPEPWLETLRSCPRRALLTSEPPRAWVGYADELAALGFVVVGANEEGLTKFGEREGDGAVERRGPVPYARPYPSLLASQPAIAATRVCPPVDMVERLVRELEGYLGPRGFTWLAACAAYPEIDWSLTLHLSQAVWATTDGPPRERDLRAHLGGLARLPWFRLGGMPDWLRATLLSQLTQAQERAVRVALAARLEALARETLARRDGVPASQIRIGAWVDPIELVRTADPASPMNDAVFLGYMGGARIPSVAVEAPTAFRRLFRRLGVLPAERRVRPAHRPWRERVAASLRSLRVYHPALAGVLLALAAGGAALGVAVPLSTSVSAPQQPEPPRIASITFTPGDDRLLVAASDSVQIWDAEGKLGTTVKLPFSVESMTFRPGGTLAVVAADGGVYESDEKDPEAALRNLREVVSAQKLTELFRASGIEGRPPFQLGPAPKRTLAAVDPARGRAQFWNDFRTVAWQNVPPKGRKPVDVSGDGELLAIAMPEGLTLATANLGSVSSLPDTSDTNWVVISGDRRRVLLVTGAGSAQVWNAERATTADGATKVAASAFKAVDADASIDRRGEVVLLSVVGEAGAGNTMAAWDPDSNTVAKIARNDRLDRRTALSSDGRVAAIYDAKSVSLYSITRKEQDKEENGVDAGREPPDAGTDASGPPPPPPRRCPALSSIPIDTKGSIAPGGDAVIKANAACIAKHPEWKSIDVVGATGSRGTAEYNLTLSVTYARRVRDLLIKAGVQPGRLQYRGVGEEWTLCRTATDDCEARNRRVELQIPPPPPPDAGTPVVTAPRDAGTRAPDAGRDQRRTCRYDGHDNSACAPYACVPDVSPDTDINLVAPGTPGFCGKCTNDRLCGGAKCRLDDGRCATPDEKPTQTIHLKAPGPISQRFGGPPYCWYEVMLSDIDLSLEVDREGKTRSARVTATFEEKLAEGCRQPSHVAKNQHVYVLADANAGPDRMVLTLDQIRGESQTALTFEGTAKTGGTLIFKRTDQPDSPSLMWTLPVPVPSRGPIVTKPSTKPEGPAARPETQQSPREFNLEVGNAKVVVLDRRQYGALGIKAADIFAAKPRLEKQIASCIAGQVTPGASGLLHFGLALHDRPIQGPPATPRIDIVSASVDGLRAAETGGTEACLRSVIDEPSRSKPGVELTVPFSDDTLLPRPAASPPARGKDQGRRAD